MTALSPDTLAQMRVLWEGSPELSAAKIGEQFRVTRNAVIGQAHRGGWERRINSVDIALMRRPPATIFTRLDALNTKLDRVLAETRP